MFSQQTTDFGIVERGDQNAIVWTTVDDVILELMDRALFEHSRFECVDERVDLKAKFPELRGNESPQTSGAIDKDPAGLPFVDEINGLSRPGRTGRSVDGNHKRYVAALLGNDEDYPLHRFDIRHAIFVQIFRNVPMRRRTVGTHSPLYDFVIVVLAKSNKECRIILKKTHVQNSLTMEVYATSDRRL